MRLFEEPPWVIDRVSQHTGAPAALVRSVIADLHHIIDRLAGADFTVVLGSVAFRRTGEPVLRKVEERFTTADWGERYGLKALAVEGHAKEIGLDPSLVIDYPVVFGWSVLHELFTWRGLKLEDPENDVYDDIFGEWRDTLQAPDGAVRRWRSSHVGLEKDFETWLLAHLTVLENLGYPLEIVAQELRLDEGRYRLDMVGRVTKDGDGLKNGDLVVIENKATAVGIEALHQLRRYVDLYVDHPDARGRDVYGLLLADGRTVELQEAMQEKGFDYLSLSELGYRDHLYRRQMLTAEPDMSLGSEITTAIQSTRAEPIRDQDQDQNLARRPQ